METGNAVIDAQSAFARERRRRRRAQLSRWLRRGAGEAGQLMPMACTLGSASPAARSAVGMRTISLDSIAGTAEPAKQKAFDVRFRPLATSRERWQRLWMAGRRGAALPPISVFRVGDQHFVSDGHHRVSVAHALGMSAIDAEVTELARAA